jgi:hypothetical protein
LRRHHHFFALPLSFFTGIQILFARIRQHHATPTTRSA